MKTLTTLVIIVLIVLGAFFFANRGEPENQDNFVACTADAKICPDGSGVGRVGPNCEFAACPSDAAFALPEAYPEISWSEGEFVEKDSVSYIDGEDNFRVAKLQGLFRTASIETEEISDYTNIKRSLVTYYEEEMEKRGWSDTGILIESLEISPLAAGGPYANIWSYIKAEGSLIKTIQLSSKLKGVDIGGDGPIQLECPCTIELSLFEPAPMSLEDILAQP